MNELVLFRNCGKSSSINMSIREVTSQRGKILLIIEEYKFNQTSKKLASGEIKWVCVNRKCKAFLRTIGDSGGCVITEKVDT